MWIGLPVGLQQNGTVSVIERSGWCELLPEGCVRQFAPWDRPVFHVLSPAENLCSSAGQHVRWSDVLERLVIPTVIVDLDELRDRNLQFSWHVRTSNRHALPAESLVPLPSATIVHRLLRLAQSTASANNFC